MFKKTQVSVWILSGFMLLFFYNNCGKMASSDTVGSASSFSVNNENYPWPNETTTEDESYLMASKVSFADVDKDTVVDGVFVSTDQFNKDYLIRVVQGESFKEVLNINTLPEPPDLGTTMYLVDLDGLRGEKELVYINRDRTRIIGMTLDARNAKVVFNLPVIEPMSMDKNYDFKMTRLAEGYAVEIAHNLIPLNADEFTVTSALTPLNGGWGDWSDWYDFSNGTICSRACGDGIQVRNRACDSPAPRNGGLICQPETVDEKQGVGSVHVQTCRVRDCLPSECTAFEIFNNGDCEPDPENPDPTGKTYVGRPGYMPGGGDSGSGGDDGGSGDNGGYDSPSDCSSGEAYDPQFYQCFQARTFNDIKLRHVTYEYKRDNDFGRSYRERVEHVHNLVLNTSKHNGIEHQTIANQYCRFQGYATSISFTRGTYKAGDPFGFYLCNTTTNGEYFGCPVQRNFVRFNYRPTYQAGQTVQYLKSVVCRHNN